MSTKYALGSTDGGRVQRWATYLNQAVQHGGSVGISPQKRLAPITAVIPKSSQYTGYFCFRQTEDGVYYICDGFTWNAETQTSNDSICMVNGVIFKIPVYQCHTSEDTEETDATVYVLHFHTDENGEGSVAIEAKKASEDFAQTETDSYYFIGRIYNGIALQEHTSHVAIIPFYSIICQPEDIVTEDNT